MTSTTRAERLDGTQYDTVVVGGGTAGCVLASRLSARPGHRVLLLEAGPDTPPGRVPADILHPYPGMAFSNPAYLWPDVRVQFTHGAPRGDAARAPLTRYEQARIMGGGSAINGQAALRAAPADHDGWQALGATGWDWAAVLPYYRRLEDDRDFDGPAHGAGGPIPISRVPSARWDAFTRGVAAALETLGYVYRADLNGDFLDGYAPLPLSAVDGRRVSTAMGYLDEKVRRRANLRIECGVVARRVVFRGRRVAGVELAAPRALVVSAPRVILAAGAIFSPALLLRSGVGAGPALQALDIPVVADVRGVGENLQEHPALNVSAYVPPPARAGRPSRHNCIYLRYSSGVSGCAASDMIVNVMFRSAWHALGARLATLQLNLMQPFSRGAVTLASPAPDVPPVVRFRLLADERDAARMRDGVRRVADLLAAPGMVTCARHPFPSSADRVWRLTTRTARSRVRTRALAWLLDVAGPLRARLLAAISDGVTLAQLVADEARLDAYVRERVTGTWHACGSCRMGRADDPAAVVDPEGRVRGVDGLRVADASVIPIIPRANTNLPTIMVAEKLAAAAACA